jgi:hypothetical protein
MSNFKVKNLTEKINFKFLNENNFSSGGVCCYFIESDKRNTSERTKRRNADVYETIAIK